MAITVNRKKLAIKTAQTVPAQPPEGGAGVPPAGIMPFAIQQKGPSYVLYGILGILAVLMFMGLLLVQWIEWSELNRPGVFPVLRSEAFAGTSGESAVQPSEAPAAAPEEDIEENAGVSEDATEASEPAADDSLAVE